MPSTDESEPDDDPLVFKSPEQKLAVWFGVIFGANMICLLLLAARSSSTTPIRGWLDVGIFTCVAGVAALGISRALFLFPFRLLDLVVMITALALGMKGAIEVARLIRRSRITEISEIPEGQLIAVTCLFTGCALMGGATVGLRYCRCLSIDSPVKRAVVLVSGMMWMPAPIALLAIPFHLLNQLIRNESTSWGELAWIVALIISAICTATNFYLSIVSSNETLQNSNHESTS
ncbi:MAG: hypothetical protein WCT04_19180 [Planctomycetota bacterium]